MAYSLHPRDHILEEVRSIADSQVSGAIKSLKASSVDLEAAVHDVRKRCKKVRALLRLVRPGFEDVYAMENRFYRDIGRRFSGIRDAQVLVQTVGRLCAGPASDGSDKLYAKLQDWAGARRDQVLADEAAHAVVADTLKDLREARKRISEWETHKPVRVVLCGGIRTTYRLARGLGLEVQAGADLDTFHEWRKRIKYHWYHCRLLRKIWPEHMRVRVLALEELGESLGHDRDLAMLLSTVEAADTPVLTKLELRRLRQLAQRDSAALRGRATLLASKLFVERPRAIADRLLGYWTIEAAFTLEEADLRVA